MVDCVLMEDVFKYGVADINGVSIQSGETAVIEKMVEKPKQEDAPSNLAVVGRYVLSPNIWKELAKTAPGAGGEIQLTDAIDHIIANETVEAYCMQGESHDCGSKRGYVKAFLTYAMRDEHYRDTIADVVAKS
jgi:UTP--glucose-1-phosphate uridylyltransferase